MYVEEHKRNTGFWWGNLKEAQGFEYVGQGAGMVVERIWRQWGRMAWNVFIWLFIGQVTGCSEHVKEPSGSIKCGEFLFTRGFILFSRIPLHEFGYNENDLSTCSKYSYMCVRSWDCHMVAMILCEVRAEVEETGFIIKTIFSLWSTSWGWWKSRASKVK